MGRRQVGPSEAPGRSPISRAISATSSPRSSGQLSAGEKEFTRLHATIWTRHNMERWAAALDKANPEIDVPDPHGEEFVD
jgi:hypothetical protein